MRNDAAMQNKRVFSVREKRALVLAADTDGEADHIEPFSAGGRTAVENGQVLSSKANKSKGAFRFSPREWQQDFFEDWGRRRAGTPFMLVAIPGGGKTFASLEVVRRWMAAGNDRRVVVVVPTVNLCEQWRDDAALFGIQLQSKEFGTRFKHDYQGGVVTYATMANQPLLFRKLMSVAPTMVILDEIHHCGEEKHYGRGVLEGCELAKEKLLLSGTPWKSDGTQIPFVSYDGDGYVVPDYRYDYPLALQDGVVRYLSFSYEAGSIRYAVDDREEHVNKDITDDEARQRLKKLLTADGEFVRKQVLNAHRKLTSVRRSVPDAAAMAVCIDQNHARQVAKVIEQITGSTPSVIVSDTTISNDSVKAFRNGSNEWLVTVKKVSEGTDIKRLQVLCYLTNVTSELFFRQVIGRVSRVRSDDDCEAYVHIPADPRLIACAKNIENAQVKALRDQTETISREVERVDDDLPVIEPYSTLHTGVNFAIIGNTRVPVAKYKHIERLSEAVGVPMEKVLQLLELNGDTVLQPTPTEADQQPQPTEELEKDLRGKCNKLAFSLSKKLSVEPSEIHMQFTPKQGEMSIAQLRQKLDRLLQMHREASSK